MEGSARALAATATVPRSPLICSPYTHSCFTEHSDMPAPPPFHRFSKSRSGDSDVGVMLALVRLGGALSSALAGLEAQLRAAIATVVPRLEALAAGGREAAAAAAAGGSGAGAELLAARLAAFPAKLPPLSALAVQASQAARFMALPGAAAAADACCAALGEAVYGALLGPVRVALEGFAGLREWRAAGSSATSSGGISLPSFSAYPLPYVTQLGEWLMALPQALEALIVEEGGEGGAEAADGDELAAEWLDKVRAGRLWSRAPVERWGDVRGDLEGGGAAAAPLSACHAPSSLHTSGPTPPPYLPPPRWSRVQRSCCWRRCCRWARA